MPVCRDLAQAALAQDSAAAVRALVLRRVPAGKQVAS